MCIRDSGYIEHRLKCAGAKGKPSFDPAAMTGIYNASGGIPRRINAVCDRLLLAGFLSGRTHLTTDDVAEVVREFEQENQVPQRQAAAVTSAGGEPRMPGGMAGAALDVDLSRVQLSAAEIDGMQQQLVSLTADQRGDQLQRLERSLLRLERTNLQTLALLEKLVAAIRKPGDIKKPDIAKKPEEGKK